MQPPWTKNVDYSTKPIFVCWETTKSCLLSCRHCRATAIKDSLPGELDYEAGLNGLSISSWSLGTRFRHCC